MSRFGLWDCCYGFTQVTVSDRTRTTLHHSMRRLHQDLKNTQRLNTQHSSSMTESQLFRFLTFELAHNLKKSKSFCTFSQCLSLMEKRYEYNMFKCGNQFSCLLGSIECVAALWPPSLVSCTRAKTKNNMSWERL